MFFSFQHLYHSLKSYHCISFVSFSTSKYSAVVIWWIIAWVVAPHCLSARLSAQFSLYKTRVRKHYFDPGSEFGTTSSSFDRISYRGKEFSKMLHVSAHIRLICRARPRSRTCTLWEASLMWPILFGGPLSQTLYMVTSWEPNYCIVETAPLQWP